MPLRSHKVTSLTPVAMKNFAMEVRASTVNIEMMLAAAKGIAVCVPDSELTPEHILPYAFDKNAHKAVAEAVAKAAIETGVSKLYKK